MKEKEYLANKVEEIKKLIGDEFGDKLIAFVPEEYIAVTSLDIANALYQLIEDLRLDRFYTEDDLCDKCAKIVIRMDAESIAEIFDKEEVDRIYLNFSDPWPKDRHAKRRLESREFLKRYNEILVPEGVVEFKTDNMDLFEFALEEVEPAGWKLRQWTKDLHHDPKMNEGNVMTEYEERFSSVGNPICKYVIYR